ncbi:hypothetical protein PAPHI01_2480 [Pancytospora philotis]|nr:hypothetical protein PAPHI01_2480 [Pancytospora philotis]
MPAVIDANYFIDKELPIGGIKHAYITPSVERELKDRDTADYYSFFSFAIEVREPKPQYVAEVLEAVAPKHYRLSAADVDVVALVLELADEQGQEWIGEETEGAAEELICLTKDNGVKAALSLFNLYDDPEFIDRRYRFRCFACYAMFDSEMDFCRDCGHGTVTRVSVVGEGENERVLLSKHFKHRPRVLKDGRGGVLVCGGQREYEQHRKRMEHRR